MHESLYSSFENEDEDEMQDKDADAKSDPAIAAELARMKADTDAGFLRPKGSFVTWPHDGTHYIGRRSILVRSSSYDD